jgi:hypothetical protein
MRQFRRHGECSCKGKLHPWEQFYLLSKIHKESNPGRQIVSANGHPTEKISEFIDFHLQPFVENLPSHIKDTTTYLMIVISVKSKIVVF